MSIDSFRDLVVWRKAMTLVEEVYRVTKSFPKEEIYGLVDQMRRAVVSVPSNIAEGYGRQSTQDYIRFLLISRGSLYEVRTHLEIGLRLGYLADQTYLHPESLAIEIEKMLSSLISKLKKLV